MPNDGIKITDLPAASEVLDSDVLAGVGGGVTRKFTFATISSYIQTKLTALFAAKQDKITANGVLQGDGNGGVTAKAVDSTPTADSVNLVASGGVAAAIANPVTAPLGSFSTLAALGTLLDTRAATITGGQMSLIHANAIATVYPFNNQYSYSGFLHRTTENYYHTILIPSGSSARPVYGKRSPSTGWVFEPIATDEDVEATIGDLPYKGQLGSGDDLDNLYLRSNTGMYYVTSGVANAPGNYGNLITLGTSETSNSGAFQAMFFRNALFIRGRTGSPVAWQDWQKVFGAHITPTPTIADPLPTGVSRVVLRMIKCGQAVQVDAVVELSATLGDFVIVASDIPSPAYYPVDGSTPITTFEANQRNATTFKRALKFVVRNTDNVLRIAGGEAGTYHAHFVYLIDPA